MRLLEHIVHSDPASPRLTVYGERAGTRMEFSGQTLDNWASKVANMLEEELDLGEGSTVAVDLPVWWQTAAVALGAIAARVSLRLGSASEVENADVVFTTLEQFPQWEVTGAECVLVSSDPFGRGIEESGGTLPPGALDFGPLVRFYGDHYFGDSPALPEVVAPGPEGRCLSTGWTDDETFRTQVLGPIAAGGSAVVVADPASVERIDAIAEAEKVTVRLS